MEIFFNLFKIKYVKLFELLREDPDINIGSDDTVNIFINLEPIFTKLCNPKVVEYVKSMGSNAQLEFISCVVNLAAHYKWFFTKYKINSRVYLYFPSLLTSDFKNKNFNAEYRMYYKHKFNKSGDTGPIYTMIVNSIPFVQLILEYIEGVYIIDSNDVENSVIPYVIANQTVDTNETQHNFIVSTSLYDFQYVNYGYSILVPKQDESELINKSNAMQFIYKINKVLTKDIIPTGFIPFILSIVGSKNRNIYNIKGIGLKSAIKLVHAALHQGLISSGMTNINLLIEIIKPGWRNPVLNNYYCTDISFQYSLLTYTDIHAIMSQLHDRFDNVALKRINDMYFKEFPLQIIEITATPSGKPKLQF